MSKLTYIKCGEFPSYTVKFNTVLLGSLRTVEDGFYYWFPTEFEGSCVAAWVIRDISNKLDELNKEWNEIIEKEFSK